MAITGRAGCSSARSSALISAIIKSPAYDGRRSGDAFHRGMRPVRRREGIVNIEVTEFGQRAGKHHVVLLLASVVAKVLEHGHFAGLQRGNAALCLVAHAILDEMYVVPPISSSSLEATGASEVSQLAAPWDDRDGSARSPQRRRSQLLDGRQHTGDARRVGHRAILHRYVEIDADSTRLPLTSSPSMVRMREKSGLPPPFMLAAQTKVEASISFISTCS